MTEYQQEIRKTISYKQLKKKVQNVKSEVINKINRTATGNKKIILKPWEKQQMKIQSSR